MWHADSQRKFIISLEFKTGNNNTCLKVRIIKATAYPHIQRSVLYDILGILLNNTREFEVCRQDITCGKLIGSKVWMRVLE